MTNKIKFSKQDLEMIRQRLSLVDFIGKRVTLKKKGNDFWGNCPFHGEKTPSFHVREDKKYYHCFGCGAHGNIFDFAMFSRGGTFPENVEFLAKEAGITLTVVENSSKNEEEYNLLFKTMDYSCKLYQNRLQKSSKAKTYLKNRGLNEETIDTFKIGYARNEWADLKDTLTQKGISQKALIDSGMIIPSQKGGFDRFRDRIMFPIENYKGQTIAFGGRSLEKENNPKYLNSPETKLFNKRYNLYALNINREHIKSEDMAIIVEGFVDVIALHQHDIKFAVAPLGTAITKEQILTLWKYNSNPIVCLDGDDAGKKAAQRLAKIIIEELQPGRTLEFVDLPEGEDPDSFVSKHGKPAFLKQLKRKYSIISCLWNEISANKDHKNPDDMAIMRKEVNDILSLIKDKNVLSQYKKSFNDLMWNFGKTNKQYKKKQITEKTGTVQAIKRAIRTNSLVEESLFLALSLQNVEYVAEHEEQFAEIIFSDNEYNILKKAISDFLDTEHLDYDSFNNYLKDVSLVESKNRVIKSCNDILKEVKHQDVAAYWNKLHGNLQKSKKNEIDDDILLNKTGFNNSESFESVMEFMENINKHKIKKG